MSKIYKPSDDVIQFIEDKFDETRLAPYGFSIKVMGVNKSKDILKVSKANATTEYLAKEQDLIQVFVYEAAWDRLPEDAQHLIAEAALSNISYDSEKDKLTIESNPYIQLFQMRAKYGDTFMDKFELGYHIIQEIDAEEAERKAAEKEAKKAKKNA